MRRASDPLSSDLPARLGEDLGELFAAEGEPVLAWEDARDPAPQPRWFKARLQRQGSRYRLSFEFWIPPWMDERGVRAILPARLSVDDCAPGLRATTHVATALFGQ